jgi:ATP-dependent helicase YprA (DUF1998 family)/Zn finger protein HypA/HybF involved in hydrogenase expression
MNDVEKKGERYGVHEMVKGLHGSLQKYIEAQYHIKDEGLVQERNALLQMGGVIAQRAYVEATPVYLTNEGYRDIAIPKIAQDILTNIAAIGGNVGLYSTPYRHQVEALEAFLGPKKFDLIVATGTGSGKTESFLMPLISTLAIESHERRQSRDMPGCRAILLYPMNALVNDQVSRIRRLLGNSAVSSLVSRGRNRPVRFGSYTGRTTYPGLRSSSKDTQNIEPLFEEFYKPVQQNKDFERLRTQLENMGRWPSKDLVGFYNEAAAGTKTVKSGKREGKTNKFSNWKYRLLTQSGDRELMTRHEMQIHCPDVLVTNYSMLEYMLMRPIETPLFEQTAEWLRSDEHNELILVLDEAHMYRGAGGAEVALLIRRLIARLGISRDRVRCILTSASMGNGDDAEKEIVAFAKDLTGVTSRCQREFEVIKGTKEQRTGARSATVSELAALSSTNYEIIADHAINEEAAFAEVEKLAIKLDWQAPSMREFKNYLFESLTCFGPAEMLIQMASGKATTLGDLTKAIFGSAGDSLLRERALDTLLILCSVAKRSTDGRIFMPTRLHLFHRGLPGLYACVNPNCTAKLANFEQGILGRFHTKPTLACNCAEASRVYDFYTHRDCGAAFLRGWVDQNCNFVWHEPEVLIQHDQPRKLYPIDMLVEARSHPTARVRQAWLHLKSGRLTEVKPHSLDGFRSVQIPDKDLRVDSDMTFEACPICRKKTKKTPSDPSKIMDHVTKGEAPFSALVRAQIAHQPPARQKSKEAPNSGRKVLIFSDGRQKAARLARDLPRDMELDLFRQVVARATVSLAELKRDAKPTNSVLYLAFLATLHANDLSMFDVQSSIIDAHIESFANDCDGDLAYAFDCSYDPGQSPFRYRVALLRLLCSNYYSLDGTTVGFVEPISHAMKKIKEKVAAAGVAIGDDDLLALSVTWIQGLLDNFSFDAEIVPSLREKAAGYHRIDWGSKGVFEKEFRGALINKGLLYEKAVGDIEEILRTVLATENGGFYLNPNVVKLTISLDRSWVQCKECTALAPLTFKNSCTACGSDNVQALLPEGDHYLRARKAFWREPVGTALNASGELSNLYVEEHTAQLSNRDRKTVHSTTEMHELRFQDVLINPKERPIDVLSCTTTMEVGIDIGSLVAVALRNVPPQRENYQQRAGRAGRRGSSVSSVVTFSQNGPHDSFYFLNPKAMVSGPPRSPELKIDNPKIAQRHIHSYLIQTYFQEKLRLGTAASTGSAVLSKSLGETRTFYHGAGESSPNLSDFKSWVEAGALQQPYAQRNVIASWLPENLDIAPKLLHTWVMEVAKSFVGTLEQHKTKVPLPVGAIASNDEEKEDDDPPPDFDQEDFLEFLFFHTLLPTYAFPNSLSSFLVQKFSKNSQNRWEIRTEQLPQQSSNQALSEYAPGRLLVINKKTYRSGGVFASTATGEVNKATKLFEEGKLLVMCDACSFLQDPFGEKELLSHCPVCRSKLSSALMIQPEVFGPEKAKELDEDDREQEYTFASMAQFPQPTNGETFEFLVGGPHLQYAYAVDKRLLTLNKGGKGDDAGFDVCKSCGCASVHDHRNPRHGKHVRPYRVLGNDECSGEFETVFLGNAFSTDLLLLRLKISAPLITDLTSIANVKTLESAAYSLAEAFRLAASRHEQLDLDATEFGAGYRLLNGAEDGEVGLDVYLYDTLAGGAGYAELAAKYFHGIINDTLALLEGCSCDSSCTECLDHFHNQHLKRALDRKLGASLLRFGLYGTIPAVADGATQLKQLTGLSALLQLDGLTCSVVDNGIIAENSSKQVLLQTYPALLSPDSLPVSALGQVPPHLINESYLRKNLPGIHAEVRAKLA